MALSRTGNHPVELRGPSHPDPEGIIQACLLEHMHHLRHIEWDPPMNSIPVTIPAPLLEALVSFNYELDIPSDFLGGVPQRLQTLDVRRARFPTTCPAPSTLTSLKLDAPQDRDAASTFTGLFALCPNLQSLRLSGLDVVFAALLPQGPAPPSLTTLELSSLDSDYDLSEHYFDWRTDNLVQVSLEQQSAAVAHLGRLLEGAHHLCILRDTYLEMAELTVRGPAGRTHTIKFEDEDEDVARTANMLLAVQSSLQRVTAVDLPITSLGTLLPVLAVLPKLRSLTLSVEPNISTADDSEVETHNFTWDGFDVLSRLPTLEEVSLDVFCPGEGDCPLSFEDARDLLVRIASLDVRTLPAISIKGFPEDVVSDLMLPEFDGVHAAQIDQMSDAIMGTAIASIRELLHAANENSITNRVPAEVLTACFLLLPFSGRLRVSHVCRSWRAAALCRPDVWTNISISYGMGNKAEVLRMALSRTGGRPVDLKIESIYPLPFAALEDILEPYWSQIRFLGWSPSRPSILWRLPAPHLKYLHCYNRDGLQIPPDFLGGRRGTLRVLYFGSSSLPPVCPALSTLVNLHIRDMKDTKDPASYRMLFVLCPQLESLSLCGLDDHVSRFLPEGPAPASLRELTLESVGSCDLRRPYAAWESGTLRLVALHMRYGPRPDFARFFRDAQVLSISCAGSNNELCLLTSEHPGEVFHSVRLCENYLPRLAGAVYAAKDVLRGVHTVRISATALDAFLPVLAVLDGLKSITIQVVARQRPRPFQTEEDSGPLPPSEYTFDWEPLFTFLPRLEHFVLCLETVTVQVLRPWYDPAHPAKADDLRGLLAGLNTHLTLLNVGDGLRVEFQGFSEDAVRLAVSSPLCLGRLFGAMSPIHSQCTNCVATGVREYAPSTHITDILNLLTDETSSILRDLVLDWSESNNILQMALSRTGNHPVVIRGSLGPDPEGVVAQCLQEHLSHIKRIRCIIKSNILPVSVAAPFLETISRVDYHLDLPVDFLGGKPARLGTLHLFTASFPATCPALSTVTNLTLDSPREEDHAATYAQLFDLCPNLRRLRLNDLQMGFAGLLPRGPAPSSLRTLELVSLDDGYDLTPHFLAWRTDQLRDVSLDHEAESLPQLEAFLDGALALDVCIEYDLYRAYFIARGAAGRTYSVTVADPAGDAVCAAEMVRGAKAGLRGVRTIQVPVSALAAFVPVLAELPALKKLGVFIKVRSRAAETDATHPFPWSALAVLQRAKEVFPGLEKIQLEV
ncbi:hypothetical protein AURDEDRAFT_128118, partial [Auricularia subglabra TFB-10046 SS5]